MFPRSLYYGRILLLPLMMSMIMFPLITAKAQQRPFTKQSPFLVGCNYWASHAGTHMWSDWRPEVIESDFKQLSSNGIKILRVFPLWPDFQPIHQIYAAAGEKKYVSFEGEPLPTTGAGSNGVSEIQLQHFMTLAKLAQKYDLKLIVGLVTGWMSGQLYIPPALEGRNILSDPESLTWQQRFVTTFVSRLKAEKAIVAWDFGNECNVMEKLDNHFQAYVWSSVIAGAIRSADTERPIISGMHGLSAAKNGVWRIEDQAALTDILTIHPYSLWTPYASHDGINTMRTIMHAAAESSMYADISGKPCLTEETGVMGPMTGGEKEISAFARTALFSNWANDCKGTLWWCAYDQDHLNYSPYNYSSVELELGLSKDNRQPKPVMNEFRSFSAFIDKLPFQTLPPHHSEAICILTENQDNWAVAYGSYMLAKQAGFDVKFQKAGQELKDAPLYLLPSLKGVDPVFKNSWGKILEKVKLGATLYLSLDDAYLPSFIEPLGIEIATNTKRRGTLKYISRQFGGDSLVFTTLAERRYDIRPQSSSVLAAEADGNPALLSSNYGKGKIFLLTFPLELNVSKAAGSFDKGQPLYRDIYKQFASPYIKDRVVNQPSPYIAVTEHLLNDKEKVVVMINYNPEAVQVPVTIKDGWEVKNTLYGGHLKGQILNLNGNDAVVMTFRNSK